MALFFGDFDPFENLLRLQRELDRFSERPAIDLGPSGRGVYPPINVFHEKDGVVVRAEVPGIAPEQLEISAEGRTLRLSGKRESQEVKNGSFHRRERSVGTFARSIQLPGDLDTSKATAECKHGVLSVRIPRSESAKPRSIQVKS